MDPGYCFLSWKAGESTPFFLFSLFSFLFFHNSLFNPSFFFLPISKLVCRYENIINFTVASIDVALPTMFVLVWICFTLMYAGFPYRSSQAAYATVRLTKVTACWCAGRLMLGYFQFSSTLDSNYGKNLPPNDHSMIILTVLVVCDILPICLSLTGSVGILLDGADAEEKRHRGVGSGKSGSASGSASITGVGSGVGSGGGYQLADSDVSEEEHTGHTGHNRSVGYTSGGESSSDMRRVFSVP